MVKFNKYSSIGSDQHNPLKGNNAYFNSSRFLAAMETLGHTDHEADVIGII